MCRVYPHLSVWMSGLSVCLLLRPLSRTDRWESLGVYHCETWLLLALSLDPCLSTSVWRCISALLSASSLRVLLLLAFSFVCKESAVLSTLAVDVLLPCAAEVRQGTSLDLPLSSRAELFPSARHGSLATCLIQVCMEMKATPLSYQGFRDKSPSHCTVDISLCPRNRTHLLSP